MSKTCINTKSPEFLKLVRDSGLSPMLLSAKVALWMDKNNTNEFPTLNQIGVSSLNKESSSQTSDRNNVEFKELFSYSDKNKQHIGVLLSKLSLMGGKTFFILKEFEKRLFKNTYYSFATAGELREQFSDFKDSDIAFYDPKSNTVFINSSNKKNNDSKLFSDTIIHEIAHAASVNRYHEIKSKINSGTATKSEIDLFNEIDKIYSIAKIELQDKFPQYFQDKNSQLEFLNGIFDNSFVDELNNIEYASKQSIFDRFLGVLMHMLGIKEKTIGEAAFKSLFNLSDIKSDKQFEESFTSSIHKIDSNFVGYNKDDFSDDTKKILEDGGKIKVSMIINDDGTEDQGETYESVDDKNNLYNRVTYGAKSLKDAFLPYSKAQKKDYATYLADKIWKDAPHDSKLSIDGKVQDYNEYLESVKIKVKRGTGVGNILHAMNELVNTNNVDKIASIRAKISRIKEDNGFSKDQFNWFTDNISDIYSTLGINKFKDIPVELKDKIACEVSVYNDLIKYAGSIDMLVENQEIYTDYETGKTGQYLSLYDLKSGYSIINGLATSILKYGEQCRYITNSAMDMSKLQVALYAVMIKMNNPSQRFKRLQVVSIANKYVATTEHPESIVDVESYIPMIEAFFKDKNNLKELGLPIDVYDKMILNNKNLFNYEHYRKAEMPERMADGIDSIDEQLAVLEQKLKEPGFKDSSKRVNEIKDQMIDLMRQKKALESYDNVNDSSLSQAQETSKLAFWTGGISESKNEYVQAFKRAFDIAYQKYTDISHSKSKRLSKALMALKDDFAVKRGISSKLSFDYTDAYIALLKTDFIDGIGRVERLILNGDGEWNGLNSVQKEFILAHEELMSEYFVGKDAYLNQTAFTDINNKEVSHLSRQNKDFIYYPGFFPKTQPTDLDLKRKYGDGNPILGKFTKEYVKKSFNRSFSYLEENIFESYDKNDIALPVKYLGGREIDREKYYSYDLGMAALTFSAWLEYKKQMDSVYSYGKAVSYSLGRDITDDEGQNSSMILDKKMIDGFLRKNVRKISRVDDKWFGNDLRIFTDSKNNTPVFFVPQKFLESLTSWSRSTTMYLKPFSASGNVMQQQFLLGRNAITYSWANKFTGDTNAFTDYGRDDYAVAMKEFSGIAKDMILGRLESNKAWKLMEKYNYIDGNNMDSIRRRAQKFTERTSINEAMMVLHSSGELMASTTSFIAQLSHMKLSDGRSFYDAYELNSDGEIKWNGGVRGIVKKLDGTSIELSELDSMEIARIKRVHEKILGGYRSDEYCGMELYAMGQFFLALKKYFPRIILNLLQGKEVDTFLGYYKNVGKDKIDGKEVDVYQWKGREIEGKLRTMITLGGMGLRFIKTRSVSEFKNEWNLLSYEQQRNIMEAMHTYMTWIGMFVLYSALFGGEDDDDARKKWFKMYMMDNLAQQYNPVDIGRTFYNMTPVGAARAWKFMEGASSMMFASMDMDSQQMSDAILNDGDWRGFAEVKKSIPYYASYYDFIKRIKSMAESNDNNQSNSYLNELLDGGSIKFR